MAGVACGWAGDGGRGEKRRRGTARAWSRRLAHRVGQPASWHAVKIMGGSVHPSAVRCAAVSRIELHELRLETDIK